MKNKLMKLLPYLIVLFVNFYLLPLMIKDTGMAMLMMLAVIPLITLFTSIIYGVKNGINLLFVILVILLFAPTIFIYYNESALIYTVIYGVIALLGNIIGKFFYNKR